MRYFIALFAVLFSLGFAACEDSLPTCDLNMTCDGQLLMDCSGDSLKFRCTSDGYECIYTCKGLCTANGNTYSGQCSFDSDQGHDVCWCY